MHTSIVATPSGIFFCLFTYFCFVLFWIFLHNQFICRFVCSMSDRFHMIFIHTHTRTHTGVRSFGAFTASPPCWLKCPILQNYIVVYVCVCDIIVSNTLDRVFWGGVYNLSSSITHEIHICNLIWKLRALRVVRVSVFLSVQIRPKILAKVMDEFIEPPHIHTHGSWNVRVYVCVCTKQKQHNRTTLNPPRRGIRLKDSIT